MDRPGAAASVRRLRDVDVRSAAGELAEGLVAEPWGQVSPSVYETGRLVTLAPWLEGHAQRLEYLLAGQRADGGWGGPGGYGLVPTLSAVEALLATLGRAPDGGVIPGTAEHRLAPAVLAAAAGRGLRLLAGTLPAFTASDIPDMPALDVIVPVLIDAINHHLDGRLETDAHDLRRVSFGGRLAPPPVVGTGRSALLRSMAEAGAELPEKVLHALEAVGPAARGNRAVRAERTGAVGASPAATAAWLDEPGTRDPLNRARQFLENVARRHRGPVPCGIPITIFERSWVLSGLARSGLASAVPATLVRELGGALRPTGVAAADGLPADADTTSVALFALAALGAPHSPESLWGFATETHFCTWQGEEGFSVSVNAHVLDAFGLHLELLARGAAPEDASASRYAAAVDRITLLLRDHQRADGSWTDRWHASPYYATMCCALALHDYGTGGTGDAVHRACRWVLATQRDDGSWGRWESTAEETAYALQILALTAPAQEEVRQSIARGKDFLLRRIATEFQRGGKYGPALWHDKDLYYPKAIVWAAVLSALHLTDASRTRLR